MSLAILRQGVYHGQTAFAGLTPATREEGAYMTPKEMIDRINQLLAQANARQLELICRIVQAVIK